MKSRQTLLCALLAIAMLCALTPLAQAAEAPAYLNLSEPGALPIVNEGESVKLTFVAGQEADWGDADDLWWWAFVREAMNIDVEIIQTMDMKTYLPLAFASGNLPDIFIGAGMSTDDLVKYGALEGQVIDLMPYVNETYMPYLTALFASNPAFKALVTTPDGALYAFPYLEGASQKAYASSMRHFVNTVWLQEAGLEQPQTLEEVFVMLRAFKERGEDIVPWGGSAEFLNPGSYIFSALGYVTNDAWGLSPALREGEVVIPAGDREAYGEYLKVMNQLYSEGLIEQDFFTLDSTTVSGRMSAGQYGLLAQAPYVYLPESFADWWGMSPVTSDINDTKIWPTVCQDLDNLYSVRTGGFVVTSACKNPEVVARMVDWYYKPDSTNYTMAYYGPTAEAAKEIGFGKTLGWEMDPETFAYKYVEVESATENYAYMKAHIFGAHGGQFCGDGTYTSVAMQYMAGLVDDVTTVEYVYNMDNGDDQYRIALQEACMPYLQSMYPTIVFFDADTSERIAQLKPLLTDYVKQETAKFIIGQRPLTEVDSYFDTLDSLGMGEYLEIYADYYEGYR